MKNPVLLLLVLTLSAGFAAVVISPSGQTVSAQSGRVKQTPEDEIRPRVVYLPPTVIVKTPTPNATATPKPSDEGDVIRVESMLVPIPVSVTDAAGRPVTTLKLEDFELQVDGKPEALSELARSESPVRLALLFDNSSSVTTARDFEAKAAIRFFRQVIRPDKDQAALFSVATATRLEQPLTRNVSQLVSAIQSLPPAEGATSLLDGIIMAANYLREAQGRRVIVIVSDGEDTLSDSTFDDTLKALHVSNSQVYVVKTTDFENFKKTGNRSGNANIRLLAADRRMQDLGGQTGGAVYSPVDERELDMAFGQIAAELAQQYILSYYPEAEQANNQFRMIDLKIKGHPNMNIRTRKGYYVSRQR
jgi:Ca-activated chloride channel homolog